jgi:hypothetical protein
MGLKLDFCWSKAAEFTRRAEEATDQEVREFLYRIRDNWVRAAGREEMLEPVEVFPRMTEAPPLAEA